MLCETNFSMGRDFLRRNLMRKKLCILTKVPLTFSILLPVTTFGSILPCTSNFYSYPRGVSKIFIRRASK